MRLPRTAAAAVISIALGAAACGTSDGPADGAEPAPPEGSAEPTGDVWPHTWVADTISGAQFAAGDLEGQDLVLWFWAPW